MEHILFHGEEVPIDGVNKSARIMIPTLEEVVVILERRKQGA